MGEGSILTLERVDRNHAGTYQCNADNGVRDAVQVDMVLKVLCELCNSCFRSYIKGYCCGSIPASVFFLFC